MLESVIATVSSTHSEFVQHVADYAGQDGDIMNIMTPRKFSSKEFCPHFNVDVSGRKVYLIATQGPYQNPQEMAMRILLAGNAAKENGAKHVTAVLTDHPYGRQDRGPQEDEKMKGQPHSIKAMARAFCGAGIDRILTMHMHSKRIKDVYAEVYGRPGEDVLYNISPECIVADYLRHRSSMRVVENGQNLVFIGVDKGSIPFVTNLMRQMDVPDAGLLVFKKTRAMPNKENAVCIETDYSWNVTTLEGKTIIIADDIIDTGGTIRNICGYITRRKPGDLYLYFTHAVCAGESYRDKQHDLLKTGAKEIICANTRPYISDPDKQDYDFKAIATVLCTEKMFAHAIRTCCEVNKAPEEVDVAPAERLYDIKRSERHFLERK
ncbi:ribose-phosphate diphosphokinase [Candidatus Woesearchaeota archaeon]|nr:ribose-phosphate diphosphokinase [Candidatus Woesearchaeota archaeon]